MAGEVKLGIIGVGQIGKMHLKRYQSIPGARVVAAADIDEPELKRVAAEYDIPDTFTDYHDLLARDDIVAVDVCLHNNLHAPVSIAVMEAGKHAFCEKPLAGSYVDALRMVERSGELGQMLSMQLSSLFGKETIAARRLLDEGRLGRPYYAKSSYYRRRGRCYVDGYGTTSFVQKKISSGGAMIDMGVYHIAQILYLLGNPEVLTVSGSTHQELPMYEHRRQESNWDVEELGIGLVRLKGGITFFIEEAWAINLGGTDGSKIAGSEGGLTLNPLAFHTTVGDMEMNGSFDLDGAQTRWMRVYPDETTGHLSPQHHWISVLQGKVDLLPTARIGLNTMLITQGIYLSQKLGREVTPAEIKGASVSTALDV